MQSGNSALSAVSAAKTQIRTCPWLLRRFYRHVPLASLSFAILRVPEHPSDSLAKFAGWALLFSKPAVAVISARYLRAFHLRAEAFADSDSDAQAIADKANTYLTLFHAAEGSVAPQGTDVDAKAFFDSLKVEHSGNRAILTANVPQGLIKKVLSETPAADVPRATQPAPAEPPAKTPKPKAKAKRP